MQKGSLQWNRLLYFFLPEVTLVLLAKSNLSHIFRSLVIKCSGRRPCPFRRHVLKWAASFAAKLTALFSRNTKDLHHEDKFTTGLGLGQGPWPEVIGKEDKSCKFGEKCLPIFPGPCSPLDQIERASELSFLIAEMTVTNSLYIPTDANTHT